VSEGPQVKLIAERLRKQLQGQSVTGCQTTRDSLRGFSESVRGLQITRVFCKGKHIFLAFSDGQFLQNHLLMRGRWRTIKGRLLLLPTEMWLALEIGHVTVGNINGQILRVLDGDGLQQQLDSLGPDVMSADCSVERIAAAFCQQEGPLGEVLLEQSVLCGIGNVAKSEALFLARVHPQSTAAQLRPCQVTVLAESVRRVMVESYEAGGRWTHRVYRRAGMKCYECGSRIAIMRQGKQARSTYFCPVCQAP
jgi:endonuclease VIII